MEDSIGSSQRIRFVLVSAVVALSLLGDALLYALLPAKPAEFRVLVWQVGVLLGANRFVRLLTNELAGRLIQKREGNGPLLAALIAGSLVTASYALPLGFWGLLCARLLWGACWSVLRVEGYISALSRSTDSNRGRIFALYQAAVRLGQGGGLLVGGFLSELIGIPWTFLAFALVSGSGVFLGLRSPPREPEVEPEARPAAEPAARRTSGVGDFLSNAVKGLAKNRHLPLWICGFGLTMAEQMIATLTGRFADRRIVPDLPIHLGIAGLSGLLLSFRSFSSLLLGPLAGHLSDRIGRRTLIIVLVVLQNLCIAGLLVFRSWQLLIACFLLQFVAGVSARLLIYTVAGDLAPDRGRALHMSRFSTFVDLGTALGPVAGFALFAAHGFFSVALLSWLLLAVVFALAVRSP
jgi:MFS family permease